MYGFPPFQFNQNIDNEEYKEYFQMCSDWLDYLKENHPEVKKSFFFFLVLILLLKLFFETLISTKH